MIRRSRVNSAQAGPAVLVSRTSILILSMFVIGMSLGQPISPGSRTAVFVAGLCGVFAYAGLEWLACYRQARSALAFELAAARLHRRLRRHIPRESGVQPPRLRRRVPPIGSNNQFLPVVTSNHRGS